jgi:hypothetical protein
MNSNYQADTFYAHQKISAHVKAAQAHRLARQAGTGQDGPSRSNVTDKLAAAFVGLAAVAAAVIALN